MMSKDLVVDEEEQTVERIDRFIIDRIDNLPLGVKELSPTDLSNVISEFLSISFSILLSSKYIHLESNHDICDDR